jgi:hypothetical protein
MHRDPETRHKSIEQTLWACEDVWSLWVPDYMLKVPVTGIRAITKKHVSLAEVGANLIHVIQQPGFSELVRVRL